MNKETLKYVLRQFHESGPPPTRARHLELPLATNKVILLRGIRRSGKTSLFFHTICRLEASGIDRRRLIYLNLEDDRLFPFGVEAMDLILQAHAELFPDAQALPEPSGHAAQSSQILP